MHWLKSYRAQNPAQSPIARYRFTLAIAAFLTLPTGYFLRFSPQLPEIVRNISGNLAYETLLILLVLLVAPTVLPRGAAIGVCLVSFGLEFLQLSQTPLLVAARSNTLGRLILGNGFTWEDFPLYVLGSLVGWAIAAQIRQRCFSSAASPER